MFCPNCGQYHSSTDVHYCSGCGFGLSAVSDALRNDGKVDDRISVKEVKKSSLIGFGLVTVSVIFLFATLILGTPEPSFVVQMNLLVALLVYLFALSYVLFKFREPVKPRQVERQIEAPMFERAPTTQNLLKEQIASDYIAPRTSFVGERTKEPMGNSVTEDTTALLKED